MLGGRWNDNIRVGQVRSLSKYQYLQMAYSKYRGFSGPYPNFNTRHQCRNFEKIISWGMVNGVDIPMGNVVRLGGEKDLPHGP